MKGKMMFTCAIALCCFIFTQASTVSAANRAKVWLGTSLVVGGIGLGAHAVSRSFECTGFDIFPPTDEGSNDDCSVKTETIGSVAMIGAGGFFLITGFRDGNSQKATKKQIHPLDPSIMIGFGPAKNGWAGSARIRW
jgi:hypothetical protein